MYGYEKYVQENGPMNTRELSDINRIRYSSCLIRMLSTLPFIMNILVSCNDIMPYAVPSRLSHKEINLKEAY